MNPSAVAPEHSNPGKGNDLLINNANYIKTVYHEYGDGQTAGLEGGVLGRVVYWGKKNAFEMFSLRTHTASMNERPWSQGVTLSRRGDREKETDLPLEQTHTCFSV